MIPIPSAPAGQWRRCSRWARSRSLSWRTPPTRPEGSLATYVLSHGAGEVGWYWHLVERELRTRGPEVVVMDLPVDDDPDTLSDYAGVAVEAIGDLREDLVVRRQLA
jgi:hypothetical protein